MMNKETDTYSFQSDWFSHNIPTWEKMLSHYKGQPDLEFLEIGSFEGRSTIWTLDNILTHPSSRIVCIDTFAGSSEHPEMEIDTSSVEETFWHNIQLSGCEDKVEIIKGYSQEVLRTLPFDTFDYAYIDGSHIAPDVLTDAVLTFPLLKRGGIMCFDDYYWDLDPHVLNRPKVAIKAFLEVFADRYELLYKGEQVFVKRLV